MIIESDYHGYRIEVVAVKTEGAWDAEVKIRRAQSQATTCFGHLSCRKPTAKVAEQRGAVCAHEWIDRHGLA